MLRIHALLIVALCLAAANVRAQQSVQARVISVTDGDTLTAVTAKKKRIKIRLAGIDAPEKRQPFGKAAKAALSHRVIGRDVTLDIRKVVRNGPLVAKVQFDGRDVNLELLQLGLAWWYQTYADEQTVEDQADYAAAEQSARESSVGLWMDFAPDPPWEWRKENTERAKGLTTTALPARRLPVAWKPDLLRLGANSLE
ncbi:MAG: thermonuclease family protein [Betaproteobacteria bacterium]